MAFLITTTGTQNPVVFNDIGGRTLAHPTVDKDLELEFSPEELAGSEDIQTAIDAGHITVKDANGEPIADVAVSGLSVPTVTQAEAEAGTGTVVRLWTPERVKQAFDVFSEQTDWDSSPDTNQSASGHTTILTAGETLAFGEVCYIESSAGKARKADHDSETTMPAMYMALGAITVDTTGTFLMIGVVRDDAWAWTPGDILYVDGTPGQMTQTQPSGASDLIQALGVAITADIVDFRPSALIVQQGD